MKPCICWSVLHFGLTGHMRPLANDRHVAGQSPTNQDVGQRARRRGSRQVSGVRLFADRLRYGHGDHVRFSWTLGPAGGHAVIKGTDFVTVSEDHIATITGFPDLVPAGA
jgi:hypothetical protein